MPPKKKAAKKTNDYEMAEFINSGTVIKDVRKNEYVVGEPVGQGGFGMIYLTDQKGHSNDLDNARYVIKIEPKKNGPLFAEINFYMRNCKPIDIDQFCKQQKISKLGIPKFMTQGIHTYNSNDLRYLIMPRFGRDLHKLFLENGSLFNREFCAQIATKMLYALEYMHSKRYAHADIKGANILLGNDATNDKEELYLIDFGLAYLVPKDPKHKPDPKCKHDGTIEYCSTDAHDGSKASFRGDLQILAWCLVHWASGDLPWIKFVKENMTEAQKEQVANEKRAAAGKPDKFIKDCGLGDRKELLELLKYSSSMEYDDEIDFTKCRSMFSKVLPKGKALALKKVKSRKSFVKLESSNLSVARTPVEKPKKRTPRNATLTEPESSFVITPKKRNRAAAKSLKRTVEETSSKEDEDEPDEPTTSSRKPYRKQQKRVTKTPAKRAAPEVEEDDASNDTRSSLRIRSSRRTRQATVIEPITEDSPEEDEDDDATSPEIVVSDESSDDSISFNQPTHHAKAIEKENLPPKKEKPVYVRTAASGRKKRLQPGKLIEPTDGACQTTKSWLRDRPQKAEQLRQWLRDEREDYK